MNHEGIYLVDRNAAGIVLVIALGIDELRHECILSAIAGSAWCGRGWKIVAVYVVSSERLSGTIDGCLSFGALWHR